MIARFPGAVAKPRAVYHVRLMRSLPFLSFLCLAILPAFAAQASSSDWHHVEGGSIRLVTSGAPDAQGHLRGALEIRLKPGWKTYWRDPGASGVPPTLEATAGNETAPVEIGFPAPARFDDGYATWAGYDHPVSLALTFALPEGSTNPQRLEAQIFLGLCETICIPVQASLLLDPGASASDPEHESVVENAFTALPRPARADFSARLVEVAEDAVLISAELPEGAAAPDLFVASTQSLTLDTPVRTQAGSQTLFRVPVIGGKGMAGEELNYTLTTETGAVSGSLRLP